MTCIARFCMICKFCRTAAKAGVLAMAVVWMLTTQPAFAETNAADSAATVFNPQQALREVEAYLNNISTFKAEFTQFADGEEAAGTFYMQRPRKFLWHYTAPTPQRLVSTGSQVFYYDEESKQVTQIPLNSGPAAILTRPQISLNSDDSTVSNIYSEDNNVVVTLELTNHELASSVPQMQLVFATAPKLHLSQIITTDQLGVKTFVTLHHIEEGVQLSQNLFKFVPPHYRQ